MNIVIGERCSGKTTKLIKRSEKEELLIVTATVTQAENIFIRAKSMGYVIQKPVSIHQFLNGCRYGGCYRHTKGILIDDLDIVLNCIFGDIPVEAVTITDRDNYVFLKGEK